MEIGFLFGVLGSGMGVVMSDYVLLPVLTLVVAAIVVAVAGLPPSPPRHPKDGAGGTPQSWD